MEKNTSDNKGGREAKTGPGSQGDGNRNRSSNLCLIRRGLLEGLGKGSVLRMEGYIFMRREEIRRKKVLVSLWR